MRFLIPAFLAMACAPAALLAQEVVQALPGTTDADRLAEQMRALAINPRDVNALIRAGELSLTLGDLSGAASLFARAEKVDPANPRIKAGEGSILVRSERPGEALRYFAQAEARGLDPRFYAADRGLAYDLIGQQERAQRDYKLALRNGANDEVIKRYALSLGISGKREAALAQIDPLLRTTDRSAWRMRAFILAMGGDQVGAEKIAVTMLPPGMAQGLQPFFQRLPSLPPADRAFAVHFGEVHATPERIADARLAPLLPMLAPEPQPVALAAVTPPPGKKERRRRGKEQPGRVQMAAQTGASPPPVVAQTIPQPRPYATAPTAQVLTQVQPLPARAGSVAPVVVASAATRSVPTPPPAAVARVTAPASSPPRPTVVAQTPPAASPPAPSPPTQAALIATPRPSVEGAPSSGSAPATRPPASVAVTAASPPAASPTVASPPATEVASSFSRPPSREEADSVLARIVASLSIPAEELGVAGPVKPQAPAAMPAPDTAARVIAEAKAKEARDAAARKLLATKALADKRAADRKAVADKKALAAKKLADDKKLAEAKAAAEEKKIARANPERIWVQVSGGAYEGDLPKAWSAVKARAPAAFAGRQGWTAPLRATNRVLTGPFKTQAEARSFVNQLAKSGISAFAFTSEAGQPVTRLSTK